MKEPLEKIADVLLFRRTDGLWVLGGDDTDATYNNQGNAIRSYFRRIGQSDKVRRVLKNTWEYSGTIDGMKRRKRIRFVPVRMSSVVLDKGGIPPPEHRRPRRRSQQGSTEHGEPR